MPDTNFTHPMRKWEDILTIVSGKNQKNVETDNGQYPIYGSGGIIGRANAFLCEAGTTIVGRKGTINSPIYVNERFWNVDTAFGIVPGPELLPSYIIFAGILILKIWINLQQYQALQKGICLR